MSEETADRRALFRGRLSFPTQRQRTDLAGELEQSRPRRRVQGLERTVYRVALGDAARGHDRFGRAPGALAVLEIDQGKDASASSGWILAPAGAMLLQQAAHEKTEPQTGAPFL